MNWILAAAAPALVGAVLLLSGWIHPAILAYHLLCGIAIFRHRDRLRRLFRGDRTTALWAAGTTLAIAAVLLAAPLLQDPAPYRELFRRKLLPWGPPPALFAVFAAYTMVVHAPLEEIFWRAVVMDPERVSLRAAIAGNAAFFYLLHAVPMSIVLGPRGALFAAPTLAAGGLWAFVTIRSRSLWPGLVSHWGADGVILAGMWFFFIR
jgi:membrane protease YdiL (CAAX protease family)